MALKKLVLLGSMVGSVLLAGCDPYQDVEVGYFAFQRELTAEDVWRQDNEVIPRCKDWAEKTNPQTWKMMGEYALNNAIGGGIGGAVGYTADAAIIGSKITLATAGGAGAYYALAAGGVGAVQGKETNDYIKHADVKWCSMADAAGYHFYSPEYGHLLLIRAQQTGWRPPAQGATISSSQLPQQLESPQDRRMPPPAPPIP